MSADFWAGYISGAAGIIIGNPLDLIKVRVQAGQSAAPGGSLTGGAGAANGVQLGSPLQRTIRRTAALATGAAAPIVGYGALNALLFVSYRQAESVLTPGLGTVNPDDDTKVQSSPAVTWMAGAVAGLATWVVSTPTELVKCRAQLALGASAAAPNGTAGSPSVPTQTQTSPSSWKIARQVWAAEGIRGFFLGGTVTALRDSIGYGFYFWSYMLMTDAWKKRAEAAAVGDIASAGEASPSHAATLLCGGLAGIVTWASVFPLDMVKTRVQSQALQPRGGDRAPLLGTQSAAAAAPPPRLSTLQITALAYREGGLGVFFRGLGVCSARAFVVNAVQWAVYEWMMRELGGKR